MINTYKDLLKLQNENKVEDIDYTKYSFLEESDNIGRELKLNYYKEGVLDKIGNKIAKEVEKISLKEAIKKLTKVFEKDVKLTGDYFIKNIQKNSNDKNISNNKSLLVNYQDTIQLQNTINYHDYTNLDKNIPPISILSNFIKEFEYSITEIKKLSHSKDNDYRTLILDRLTELTERTNSYNKNFNTAYVDNIKAEIIKATDDGTNASVSGESINDFITRLFLSNDGFNVTEANTISPDMVQRSYERYSKINNHINSIERTQKNLIAISKRVEQSFKKNTIKDLFEYLSKTNGNQVYNDDDLQLAIHEYFKAKYYQLQMVYQIIWNVFYTRLTFIYTSSVKDRQICLKAIEWNKYHNIKESVEEDIDYDMTVDEEIEWDEDLEDDLIKYENYIAFRNYQDTILEYTIQYQTLHELDMKSINKSVEEFLKTIAANIQKVFNSFKNKVNMVAWNKIKETYGDYFNTDRPMVMSNIDKNKDYLPNTGEIIKFIQVPNAQAAISPEIAEKYKSEAKNGEEIISKIIGNDPYFSNIDAKNFSKSADELVNKNCFFVPNEGAKINLEVIKNYVEYMDNYEKNANYVQEDIKNINSRIKDFEAVAQTINHNAGGENTQNTENQNATQNTTESSMVVDMIYTLTESYITEMDLKDEQNPDGKNNINTLKMVKDFFKVYNTVLSLKMKTLDKGKNKCMSICLNYGRNAKNNS